MKIYFLLLVISLKILGSLFSFAFINEAMKDYWDWKAWGLFAVLLLSIWS